MSVTVGLVKELEFISNHTGSQVVTDICMGGDDFLVVLNIVIKNGFLYIRHEGEIIWHESLDETTGNFGLESCQQISQILNNKHKSLEYRHLIYKVEA